MVQKIVTELVSDLSGEAQDVATVIFGVNGTQYELELTGKEREQFEKALEPYVAVARKTAGRGVRRNGGNGSASSSSTSKRDDLAAIRSWARENGHPDLGDRGRIPNKIVEAYDAAH